MNTVLALLPLLGAGAIIVLAQLRVKERSEKAALLLTAGAGLEVAYVLAAQFVGGQWLSLLSPLVQVGSVAGVVYGLYLLLDEAHPKQASALPAALAAHQEAGPNLFIRGFVGFFGVAAMIAGGALEWPLLLVPALLALAGALAGSMWVERQGPLGRWVLERRPDLVVWSYVHKLKVVNRRSGTSTLHHSAQVGLVTGAVVPLPAGSELQAQTLVRGVAERCPGISLGYTPEQASRFKSSPQSLRPSSP